MDNCIVKMRNISVEFPGVRALNHVDFDIYGGKVNVLLGENGAGKSTIMKVLAGVNTDYSGSVIYKGEEIRCSDIREQQERGISIIFQETNLLTNLTVAENIFLGRPFTTKSRAVNWKKVKREAKSLLRSIGCEIPESKYVSDLSVGEQQMVEIAKAISRKVDVLIMDEPTSALTEKEVGQLFRLIERLKGEGVAIVYISHRLKEILQIGDWLTVLRDGKLVKSLPVQGLTVESMVAMMVGRDIKEQYPRIRMEPGEKILEVRNLSQGKFLKNISFYARRGEILSFYGLMGAGRTELFRAVFGADKFDSGEIFIRGKRVEIRNCKDAKEKGIALLTEDRKNQGLILEQSVKENITLSNIPGIMNKWGILYRREEKNARELADSVKVKTPSLRQLVKNLSGGNQQKVVIAKWLNTSADIIIFDEPTRGIDVGAKVEIYKIMNEIKRQGKAIIMISSEMVETMGMCDRMYVMHDGRITAHFEAPEGITEEKVMQAAVAEVDS